MVRQHGITFSMYGCLVVLLLGIWNVVSISCSGGCKTALDCGAGKVCLAGACLDKPETTSGQEPIPGQEGSKEITPQEPGEESIGSDTPDLSQTEEGNNDTDAGVTETTPELPPEPQMGELVINEVLFDPATGTDGDANKDGTRDSSEDEFIEIVNLSKNPLLLGGVALDVDGKKFVFPEGTIVPGETAVVVFGGGMKQDTEVNTGKPHAMFGEALVFTKGASGSLPSLTNKAATIKLLAKDGTTVLDTFAYGTAECPGGDSVDQSVTRSPDGTGKCVLHRNASPDKRSFSPGTRADGSKFRDPLPEPVSEVSPDMVNESAPENPADGGEDVSDASGVDSPESSGTEPNTTENPTDVDTGQTPVVGDLVINEILATPDATSGDANKDGIVSTLDDEFVEIVNKGTNTLQMKGVEVYINTSDIFVFPSLLLKPKQAVVIFRAGMANDTQVDTGLPHSQFGGAIVYRMMKKINLTNTGATVELKLAGVSLDTFTYGGVNCKGDQNQSVTKSPELTGNCVLHKQADPNQSAFSPGTQANGQSF